MRITQMPKLRLLLLFTLITLFVGAVSGQAELSPEAQSASWKVFLQHDDAGSASTLVTFVDLLTGAVTAVETTGERHTLIDGAVLYFDHIDGQVKLAKPDGIIRDHPFIVLRPADQRVDWAVSADGKRVAWALSSKNAQGQLTTSIQLADAAGTDIRELLVYGPRAGVRLAPVAFSAGGATLYIEVQAEATAAAPYTKRGGLFALNVDEANPTTQMLPGDQSCYCAVAFGGDIMLRLVSSEAAGGIALEIYALGSGARRVAPAVSRGNYNEAGNILISPDGTLAVYALSQANALATSLEEIRSVLVLADLQNARQMVFNHPMTDRARPVRWTEDNSAIIFTQSGAGETWKIQVDNGTAIKISDSAYLGMLGYSRSD